MNYIPLLASFVFLVIGLMSEVPGLYCLGGIAVLVCIWSLARPSPEAAIFEEMLRARQDEHRCPAMEKEQEEE